jgi:UDP-galactopyranose mutase
MQRFAEFNRFVNRPKVIYRDKLYSFPINLMTLYQVFGTMTPEAAHKAMAADCEHFSEPENMEQWCLSNMGRTLYETFIEGYTAKQWGRHPRDLPASLLTRLPVRLTFDDNYYKGNPWQGIPIGGYTLMVQKMLEGVPVELGVDYGDDSTFWQSRADMVVYSGAIDEFFDYQFGTLDYRSMRFDSKTLDGDDYQGTAVINYTAAEVPYTRVIEHKHFDLLGPTERTVVTWEYPEAWEFGKDRTYPLRTADSRALYERYVEHAQKETPNVVFGGRLGSYSYLDMDQVIMSAMARARTLAR